MTGGAPVPDFKFAEEIPSGMAREECAKLAELCAGKTVLEVGSYLGRSTVAVASVARLVHSVDWHKGDMHAGMGDTVHEFFRNLERYGLRERTVVHVGRNEEVLPSLVPGTFDVCFIDSFHAREAVERDVSLCRPLVKAGGAVAFHDYGLRIAPHGIPFGVTEAVDSLVSREGLRMELTRSLAVVFLR